ncbi:hypothetical protein Tco_0140539 [Tanacetum coccineum]
MFDEYFTPPSIAVSLVQEAAAPSENYTPMVKKSKLDEIRTWTPIDANNFTVSMQGGRTIDAVHQKFSILSWTTVTGPSRESKVTAISKKCNMRLKTDIKPKEATFQVVLDALALTLFYRAFLITADVPAIYMQEFWATVSVHKSSIRFMINKKKVSLDVDIFREILQFCPKIPRQKFENLPLEHDILSFIKDLGHSRDIIYLFDVSVDCLHQPWRAFATIINMCLSGKETRLDKIRLSRAQILWGCSIRITSTMCIYSGKISCSR